LKLKTKYHFVFLKFILFAIYLRLYDFCNSKRTILESRNKVNAESRNKEGAESELESKSRKKAKRTLVFPVFFFSEKYTFRISTRCATFSSQLWPTKSGGKRR